MTGSIRAGVYTRISLDVAGEGLGVERQEQKCRELAQRKGWTVTEVYRDNDVSASSGKERPEYQRMLADLEAGTVNAVVVYAIDRLTRRPVELEHFIDLVERHGTQLANVAGDVQLDTVQGRLTARIMGNVARAEAENIGKRVRDQKQQRAAQGIPHKGRHRVYGYDQDWNLINSEAAQIKEAFERRAAGESTTSIAKDFTKRGIKTVSGRNWTSGVLGDTLTKHVYCGKVTFKGDVVADSIYPAIVDEPTFNAAQKNLANDSKGTNARKYLLSGILLCRLCLSPMKGNPANHMYRCSTTYGGCGRLSVRIKIADQWITWAAMEKANEKPRTIETVRDFDQEIEDIKTARVKTQEAFEAGVYTLAEAKSRINGMNDQLKAITKEQAKATPKARPYIVEKFFDFKRMNLSQQRAFIGEHITNVVVGPSLSRGHQPFNPGRFEAHYTDGTTEILARDLEADYSPEDA